MGTIVFESVASTLVIHNPLNGFAARSSASRSAATRPRRHQRPQPVPGRQDRLLRRERPGLHRAVGREERGVCIFCGDRLAAKTARYPDDLVPGGRLARGEATLLPNLFALGAYHPLVVLSRAHFLEPGGFTPALLSDGLAIAREFLLAVHRARPRARLRGRRRQLPAAGRRLHRAPAPADARDAPPVHPPRAAARAPAPATTRGTGPRCSASSPPRSERLGARHVASSGGWRWLAACAPQGCNEVLAVHETARDLAAARRGARRARRRDLARARRLRGDGPALLQLRAVLGARGRPRPPAFGSSSGSSAGRTSRPRTATTTTSCRSSCTRT